MGSNLKPTLQISLSYMWNYIRVSTRVKSPSNSLSNQLLTTRGVICVSANLIEVHEAQKLRETEMVSDRYSDKK